jgi:antitoxin HicB
MSEEKERSPVGQTFESWLEEEGLLEETTEQAIKAVISWQLRKAMEERGLSKKAMADSWARPDRSSIGSSTRRARPSP